MTRVLSLTGTLQGDRLRDESHKPGSLRSEPLEEVIGQVRCKRRPSGSHFGLHEELGHPMSQTRLTVDRQESSLSRPRVS